MIHTRRNDGSLARCSRTVIIPQQEVLFRAAEWATTRRRPEQIETQNEKECWCITIHSWWCSCIKDSFGVTTTKHSALKMGIWLLLSGVVAVENIHQTARGLLVGDALWLDGYRYGLMLTFSLLATHTHPHTFAIYSVTGPFSTPEPLAEPPRSKIPDRGWPDCSCMTTPRTGQG
jgi:hypothetical protein